MPLFDELPPENDELAMRKKKNVRIFAGLHILCYICTRKTKTEITP